MAKHKRPTLRIFQHVGEGPAPDPRHEGLIAFQAGRFDSAIAIWSELGRRDPAITRALAEAYFRRALTQPEEVARFIDLERASSLAPEDPRYHYHLGMAMHRRRDLAGAIDRYRDALRHDPAFPGAGLLLALATLEQDPAVDLRALPGSSEQVCATLAPVSALVRGEQPVVEGDGPLDRLWRGLWAVRRGEDAALDLLADNRPLPAARATAVRRYYRGVAAARARDLEAALKAWQHVAGAPARRPWLQQNLAVALLDEGETRIKADILLGTGAEGHRLFQLALDTPALAETLARTLDRAGHDAAAAGDWTWAAACWEQARDLVSAGEGLGSPRVLLHDLALAYEALERWSDAATAWRAMLRTRPRKARAAGAAPVEGEYSDAQWAWVRKRVIECYKRAGTPGEAVSLFRQALKKEPGDLETRLQLAAALIANDQEQAAINELRRILEIDPRHIEATLGLIGIHSERGEWYQALPLARALWAQAPDREDVRRVLIGVLLEYGSQMQAHGSYQAAITAFEEGWGLAPDDWHFPVYLARVQIDQGRTARARTLLVQAEALAGDDPAAYLLVLEAWAASGAFTEARAVLDRAEAALSATADFYLEAGRIVLAHRPPSFDVPRKAARGDEALTTLAVEIMERAAAREPENAQVRLRIARTLMLPRSDLALQYAEEAARLAPESPEALIALGTIQGLNDRTREARQTLRNAARLARRQGDSAHAAEADDLARRVGTPLFRLGLEMQQVARILDLPGGLGDLDLDFEDDPLE